MVDPLGVLITGEIYLSFLHLEGRSLVVNMGFDLGPRGDFDGLKVWIEEVRVGGIGDYFDEAVVCVFEADLFSLYFAELYYE